jgi:pimeloyl-ACP methyl ester carboxylesterase
VVPDLRGSGGTEDSGEPLALDTLVSDVLAVAAHAGLDRFDLAGFSLGGFVALGLAATAPERVRSLTVIAAGASGRDSRTRLQFELWRDLYQLDRDLFARLWLLTGLSPAFVATIPPADLKRAATFRLAPGLGRQCVLNAEVDMRDRLDEVVAPTLVIGCRHDVVFPPSFSRELAESLPSARYLELDSGHMAVVEAPAALAQALCEFLADTGPGRA